MICQAFTKVKPVKTTKIVYVLTVRQIRRISTEYRTDTPTTVSNLVTFQQLVWHIELQIRITSLSTTVVFRFRPDCCYTRIKGKLRWKKLYRGNHGSSFLKNYFSNRYIKSPNQVRKETSSKHLKRRPFQKNRYIYFYSNSVRTTLTITWNYLSFPIQPALSHKSHWGL